MSKNLEISLDRNSHDAIYMQLYNQIVQNITSGNLERGDSLPSSRVMAGTLGINFHTVNQAYQRLRENGIIASGKNRRYIVVGKKQPGSVNKLMEKEAEVVNEALAMGYSENDIIETVRKILANKS
ncbi:MAG: GntR family transcriptional regulator [Ferroplasma sp.]|uniref:GntR family transcriptional regulator n=1 Tax=Ferroplasma sp. TaxID=2591003 RepID=UPI0028169230|nr:GntR family transcriptional regulator [Ferroplasma sp.]WMT50728.1 MAG: GntR family transcriptional regulator [Ferroplasma sp.]